MLLECTPVMHEAYWVASLAEASFISHCFAYIAWKATDWVSLLQPSRSLLIMLDMSGLILQHIQHSRQWQGEGLLDFVQ